MQPNHTTPAATSSWSRKAPGALRPLNEKFPDESIQGGWIALLPFPKIPTYKNCFLPAKISRTVFFLSILPKPLYSNLGKMYKSFDKSLTFSLSHATLYCKSSRFIHIKPLFDFIFRPATHPIHFAADSPRQNHRCAAWAVFFFFTNKILCSCSIFQNLFLVVDCTTVKCYSCA